MRQIITARNGGVEVLRIGEAPTPVPKQNEVLIRVQAAGLNFADILARQELYVANASPVSILAPVAWAIGIASVLGLIAVIVVVVVLARRPRRL